MNVRRVSAFLLAVLAGGCLGGTNPYRGPPETDDPWALVDDAAGWLSRGRPRAAMPSLVKAEAKVDDLGPGTPEHTHARAAIYNERGRVFVMLGERDRAEAEFLRAATVAEGVPQYRPLHFQIENNLSYVYEQKGRKSESCAHLRRAAALHHDLLANPAEPPEGYGAAGERFLREKAAGVIEQRSRQIACDLAAP